MTHSKRNRYYKLGGDRTVLVDRNDINTMKSLDDFYNLETGKCPRNHGIIRPVRRIIAVGDVHGDLTALLNALKRANVIDNMGAWIGDDTIVVQVGDVLDRGGRGVSVPSSNALEEIEILYYLYKLNNSAIKVGGKVISLLGNHELMNMIGDFRYVSPEHLDGLGGYDQRKQLFRPGGPLAQKIACNSLGIVKIGDWVFVHGGLLPQHVEDGEDSIHQINQLIREILLGEKQLHSISHEDESLLFGNKSIFWTRKYSNGYVNQQSCNLLNTALSKLDITGENGGIVVGHTPQQVINSECEDRVWRIDTGMSEAFGRKVTKTDRIQVLEILNNDSKKINII